MRPIRLDELSQQQLGELDRLYHTTRDVRVRTRAQMVLLAAERGLVAAEIAAIVRQDEGTVRRWLARYEAEGAAGLSDAPRAGRRRRSRRPTAYASCRSCGSGHAASACHSRSGPPRAWRTTWPRRRACGSASRASTACCAPAAWR